MQKIFFTIISIIMLISCTTGYHAMTLNGGFEEFQLDANTYTIKFTGNRFSNKDLTEKYALRRAAELSREKGFKYFKILHSTSNIIRNAYQEPITEKTVSSINHNANEHLYEQFVGTSTISGGNVVVIEIPYSSITIQLMKEYSPNAMESEIILHNFAKKCR